MVGYPRISMKIAVLNEKGGVGKTTVSVNLAYGLAKANQRTLLVDLDTQANSSIIYLPEVAEIKTIRDLFLNRTFDPHKAIHPAYVKGQPVPGLQVLPSNRSLKEATEVIATSSHREKLLHNQFKKIIADFDFILMDCPPAPSILTKNAIFTADLLLIPTNYSVYSLDGISELFNTIAEVKEFEPFQYRIVRNIYNASKKTSNQFIEQNLDPFREFVLKTVIRQSEALNQAQMNREPVYAFDSGSNGAIDFSHLTHEIMTYGQN